VFVLFTVVTLLPLHASHQEQDLQAVFIGRFAKFIEWPSQAQEAFHITIVGQNPFGNLLSKLYANKKIHGKPVKIRHIENISQIGQPQLLFITVKDKQKLKQILEYAQQNAILTVSDQRGFTDRGGIIQLSFINQKPYLIINNAIAKRSRITIKAQLLAIAQEVIK